MSDGDDASETADRDADPDSDDTYLVEIKRSARRRSAAAGEHVRRAGRYREFVSKALAREWAREASLRGDRIWIQDTLPTDSSPADGYLVGGRRSGGRGARASEKSQATLTASASTSE